MEQVLQTFHEESRELLAQMEQILLELETNAERSLFDALFRCVHTIKGSSGMFALDHVVEFTHVVEGVLDELRNGDITLDKKLAQTLLLCRDHIATLIDAPPDALDCATRRSGSQLIDALSCGRKSHSATALEQQSKGLWHLSMQFDKAILTHGMDPISFLAYLSTIGKIISITTIYDAIPPLSSMNPEDCYLAFELELQSDASREEIAQTFEFADTLCHFQIHPSNSDLGTFIDVIEALPDDRQRLGELLVASGALSEEALACGLATQEAQRDKNSQDFLGEVLVNQGVIAPALVDAALHKQQKIREQKIHKHLRVRSDKLDQLINLVGELVISSSTVALSATNGGDIATRESAAAMSLLVEEIRDRSLQLRMIPIGETFQRFQRVVRDISASQGKDIELLISGADTELDKTVVEQIADPLTHLVRNASDHGIEPSEERIAGGKKSRAAIRLNAYHQSGAIIIEVCDDGRGLDIERIRQKAIERALITAETTLSEQDIFNLIFEPGFSTAQEVTNISGRGVGMDVVKRNIEALRGTVEIESRRHIGTTCRIRLPLTLAIIDGFLSTVGDVVYVVALEMIEECVEIAAFDMRDNESHSIMDLRGEVLPLLHLRHYFGVNSTAPRRQNVLIVSHAGIKAGLIVDELIGEHQTVIKPLSKIFSGVEGLAGSTILGSGRVALILDIPGLLQQALSRQGNVLKQRNMHFNAGSKAIFH